MPEFLLKCNCSDGYWYKGGKGAEAWLPEYMTESVLGMPEELLPKLLDSASLLRYFGSGIGPKQVAGLLRIVLWRLGV